MHGPMNEGESATNVKMLWIISSGRSEKIISNLIDYTAVVTDFPMAAPHYIILSLASVCGGRWRQKER